MSQAIWKVSAKVILILSTIDWNKQES